MPLQAQEPAVYNAGVGYPVDEQVGGNLTVYDPSATGLYGNISARSFANLPVHNQGLQPSGDTTGAKDTAAINRQLTGAANLGVTGQLELGAGIFYLNQSILFTANGGGFIGSAGAVASADGATLDLGTVIRVASGLNASAFTQTAVGGQTVAGILLCLDQNPGGTGNPTRGLRFRDFWIDATNSPAGVDGMSFFGAVQNLGLDGIGVLNATGAAWGFYKDNNASFGQPFPDGVSMYKGMAQACGTGFTGKADDTHVFGVHVQSCTGDGFTVTGGNIFFESCSSDHNLNGYTIDSQPGGTFDDPVSLVNCGTEGNAQNGLNVTNTSPSGTTVRNHVIVAGCKFDGDGVNGGAGGGGFAGIAVAGKNIVAISNTHVVVRTNNAAGGCPQYGLATASIGTSPGIPTSVVMSSGFLGYVTSAVNDAASMGAALIISGKVITGQGLHPSTVTPWPEALAAGSLTLSGAYSTAGSMMSLTDTVTTASSPILYVGAVAADSVAGVEVTGDTNQRWKIDTNGKMSWGPGNAGSDTFLSRQAAGLLQLVSTDFDVATAGRGLRVHEGSNAKQGTATLSGGTVVVSNTSVTANSRIFLTAQDTNSTGALRVSARTAGTSFTITSSNAGDSGVVAYEIFEPG